MKRFLVALLLAVASLIPLHAAQPYERSVFPLYFIAELESGAKVWWNSCTTWAINPAQHLLLTAAHCVANEDGTLGPQQFVGFDHKPAKVLRADIARDIALLWAELPTEGITLRTRPIHFKDNLEIPSYQLGWSLLMLTTGRVTNPDGRILGDTKSYLWHSVYGCGGSSGAPILDKNGAAVSLEQVGARNFEPCSGVGGGATQAELADFAKYFAKVD